LSLRCLRTILVVVCVIRLVPPPFDPESVEIFTFIYLVCIVQPYLCKALLFPKYVKLQVLVFRGWMGIIELDAEFGPASVETVHPIFALGFGDFPITRFGGSTGKGQGNTRRIFTSDVMTSVGLTYHAILPGSSSRLGRIPVAIEKHPRLTAVYTLAVVQEADRCDKPGQIGALLRREGLYSSHMGKWRQLRDQGALDGLYNKKRGPKPGASPMLKKENEQLRRENAWLQKKLAKAEMVIDFQKKVAALLDIPLSRPDDDGSA